MSISKIQTLISGQPVNPPDDWQNNTIHASFGTDSSQPQIETDRFEYTVDGAAKIISHKDNGDIFERLPCQQVYTQNDDSYLALDGYFDVSDGYEELDPTWGSIERPNRVLVKFKQDSSVSNFLDQINGVSFGSLVNEGFIGNQDYTTIKTVIVKRTNFIEVAMSILTIYIIQKQIRDVIRQIQDSVDLVVSTITGGISGSVAGAILAVALLIIQIAYAVVLLALLVTLIKGIIDLLIPPVIKNKGIKFRTLLQKSCEKFGYTLESPIEELDFYYVLPSKPFTNETDILDGFFPKHVPTSVGIPSTSDYGYLMNEFWDLMKSMFNTKISIVGGVVQLRNANDPYWIDQSTFIPRKTINFPSKKYNTEDLSQTRMMTFVTDNDEWTVENYTGTSFEIKTESTINSVNNSIKGLDRTFIDYCLPNNKTKTNAIEDLMILLAKAGDELSSALGKNSNFAATIESNRINVLKISTNDWDKPRVVPLINNQLPPNHRELLSAKVLMQKYHYGKSFVTNGQLGQKVIYEDITIPFLLSDLQKTLQNGSFVLPDGRLAEFIEIDYNFSRDVAECSISVQEIYTNKLKEVTYEP